MKRDLRFEELYPYPIDRVWEAITDPEAISDWLMPTDFAPRLGHKFQFHTKPAPGFDGIVNCEVIELDPPRRLSYTWKGGGIDTVATFTLEAVPEGTKLVLEHKGFTGPRGMMVSLLMSSGWKSKILPIGLLAALQRYENGVYHHPEKSATP
jgi:uncharacterized protein YndB with AHSA1/START domain